jgi:hypothetical protein
VSSQLRAVGEQPRGPEGMGCRRRTEMVSQILNQRRRDGACDTAGSHAQPPPWRDRATHHLAFLPVLAVRPG